LSDGSSTRVGDSDDTPGYDGVNPTKWTKNPSASDQTFVEEIRCHDGEALVIEVRHTRSHRFPSIYAFGLGFPSCAKSPSISFLRA
jgi:hypothetical protein